MIYWTPGQSLEQAENQAIRRTLEFYGGKKTWTAKALRICIRTLRNRIRDNDELAQYRKEATHVYRSRLVRPVMQD